MAVVCWSLGVANSLVFPPYLHSYGIRKATPKHLFMFFGPRTRFDNPQGLATTKLISRDDPETKKDDDEVVVYGVNAGRHELIYNTSMWSLGLYGSKGSGKNEFYHPRGIATEPHGNVFVADSGNNRIVHLFNPKRKVHWVRAYYGRKQDSLRGPSQVAVDESGRVYVSDTRNRRIAALDTTTGTIGNVQTGFVDGPGMIVVADGRNRWSHYRGERFLFCADRGGTRIWKIGFDGAVAKKIEVPPGHRVHYGAVDFYHNLWVTDTDKHCVLKFDHNLKLLDVFGSRGTDDNQFVEPRGIAIWKRYGQTFIAERKGAQYYWIGTRCKSARLSVTHTERPLLLLDLTEHSYVSLFQTTGSDTTYCLPKRMVSPGRSGVPVGGCDGSSVKKGETFTLRVEPTYSSYTYRHWDIPLTAGR